MDTVCIRCGKKRVFGKKWTEKAEKGAVIIHEDFVCPDRECQKIVDADFAARREKRLAMEDRKNTSVKI